MGLSVLCSYKHTAQAHKGVAVKGRVQQHERGKDGRRQKQEGRLTPPEEERKNQIPGYVTIQKLAGKAKTKATVGYWTVVTHTHTHTL